LEKSNVEFVVAEKGELIADFKHRKKKQLALALLSYGDQLIMMMRSHFALIPGR